MAFVKCARFAMGPKSRDSTIRHRSHRLTQSYEPMLLVRCEATRGSIQKKRTFLYAALYQWLRKWIRILKIRIVQCPNSWLQLEMNWAGIVASAFRSTMVLFFCGLLFFWWAGVLCVLFARVSAFFFFA